MSRRWLAILLVLTLVGAACGDDDDSGDTTTTAGTTETTSATTEATSGESESTTTAAATETTAAGTLPLEGVELQVMGWSSSVAEDEALAALLDQFSAETGASASFNPQPEYDPALQAALAAGDPPDVFYVDSSKLPDLVDAGALAPVPAGSISDPDDIYSSLREAFTYDGTWYCPPKDFSTLGLVYDVDAFAEAGLEVPTTWDELATAAAALTTDDRFGLVSAVEYPRWGVFLFQAGAGLTDPGITQMTIDTPEARQALEFVSNLYVDGYATTPAAVDAGWNGEAFGRGNGAMTISGNWIANYLIESFPERNFAVAELPQGPAGSGTFAFTVCYGVGADAENPEASWALVEWLTNAEGSLAWTNAFNVMPARASVADEWIAGHESLAAFVAGADYATKFQFVPGFADVLGVFNDQASGLIAGDLTLDDMIETLTSAGEDILGN